MTNTVNCLIHQSDCGLQAGQTECPKCGMRTDVRYVSKEDMDAAQATAKATWGKSEKIEAAKRVVKVKPKNVAEAPAVPGKNASDFAKPKTEQTVIGEESSGSKPSRSMTPVVVALLVLGGGSYAYVQHKGSQALEESQRTAQVQLTAPAPAQPSIPMVTSTSSPPLGSNSAIEKVIVDFNLQNCKRDVFTKLDADWNKDVRSMRFVYLSLSNCNQSSENGGRVLIIPKDESCSAVSYPSPELANIIGYAPMEKGITAFTLDLGENKMKQTIYWKSPSASNPYNCAGSMSFYSK